MGLSLDVRRDIMIIKAVCQYIAKTALSDGLCFNYFEFKFLLDLPLPGQHLLMQPLPLGLGEHSLLALRF